MLKVLHIIDHLGLGGAQILLKTFFELQIDKENIYLYVLRETDLNINVTHPNVYIYPDENRFAIKALKSLKNIIKTEKIDIIHCHLFRSQVFGWILKFISPQLKLVFHEHGRIFLNQKLYNKFLEFSLSKVDIILAVSNATKEYLKNLAKIPENKIGVIYNFIDLEFYSRNNINWNINVEKQKHNIYSFKFVIGFAGRLIERKGWRIFVLAAMYVLERHPNTQFIIAGSGKDEAELLLMVDQYNLEGKVNYLGYVPDMVWFYSLLNCLVVPSYSESMGLTVIEAQAMGIPVIASDVEALNEIITKSENGLLFHSKDSYDLADKISIIIENEQLRKKLIIGGIENAKKFSLENYLINIENSYSAIN